jgi:glycosyltransferase involved in cell wall biosynthesis
MKVSVIIPCLNAVDTIGAQLEALSNQNYKGHYEIIVADNGSTDGSLTIIKNFSPFLDNLRIIDASTVKGAGHARNTGASAACGDVFLFCDADDVVGEDWVGAMVAALAEYEFVAGRVVFKSASKSWGRPWISQYDRVQKFTYPPYLDHAASCNIGIRRDTHEKVGGFDETWEILEDTDYCWRIQLTGTKLCFEPRAVVYLGMRDSWAKTLKQSWLWGRYNVLLYKSYRSKGMPKLHMKTGITKWKRLFRSVYKIRNQRMFEEFLWNLAWQSGRLYGCLRYRVLAI